MKKYILGFFSGILVSLGLLYLYYNTNEDRDTRSASVYRLSEALARDNMHEINSSIGRYKSNDSSHAEAVSKNINHQTKNSEASLSEKSHRSDQEVDSEKKDSPSPHQMKNELLNIVENLEDRDILRAKRLIEHLNTQLPEDAFAEESVDLVWANQAQEDLEYSFYSESPLKDLGTLESITCKSQYCKVLVHVPADTQLQTSTLIDWANPRSINVKPPKNESDTKVIELLLSRDRLNKTKGN